MYGNLKTQLQTELDEIRAAGLYKAERVIDTPQGAGLRSVSGEVGLQGRG